MTIMALAMGGAIVSFRSVAKSELRASASKMAGAIRYCFDRAITTGAYYRIVLDLDKSEYWAERSDDRFYLAGQKENSPGGGKALDVVAQEKLRDEEDQKLKQDFMNRGTAGMALDPPPIPRRAKFQTFKDAALPKVTLKKVQLFDLYTPRQKEAYTQGKAYLYFFPDGHTERALLRMNSKDDFYSLIVHPLTGRVEVKAGKVDVTAEFDNTDEEGNKFVR